MLSYDFFSNLKLYKYYDEPLNEYNVVSTVLFRLRENYKSMSNYYEKIMKLVDNFHKFFPKSFYLRIYFDTSIIIKSGNELIDKEIDEVWIKLLKKLKKYKFIQLCRYKHKDYLDGNFHHGVFGTIIRFLPLFDLPINKNIKTIIISDADVNFILMNNLKNGYYYALKNNLNLVFKTSFCKYTFGYHSVTKNFINTWLRIMAGTVIVNNYKFNTKILNDFFGMIINHKYDEPLDNFINMTDNIMYKNKMPKEKIFKYGFDEFFLIYLLKDIIDHNGKIGYIATRDFDAPIYYYYYTNNNFITDDSDKIKIYKEVLKFLLQNYYDDHKSLQDNYLFYEKNINGIYDIKPLNAIQIKLSNNTFNFYEHIDRNNLYKYFNINKYNVKCGLFQKNKNLLVNHNNEYFIYDRNKDLL
jgi:hypothetical protein